MIHGPYNVNLPGVYLQNPLDDGREWPKHVGGESITLGCDLGLQYTWMKLRNTAASSIRGTETGTLNTTISVVTAMKTSHVISSEYLSQIHYFLV